LETADIEHVRFFKTLDYRCGHIRLDAMDGSLERDVLLRKRLVRVVDPPTVCGKLELFIFRKKWGIAQRLRLQVCVCVCVCHDKDLD